MDTTVAPGPRQSLVLRDVEIPNRIWMSPMCQYSASADGRPTDWHQVHYGSRAVGGAGLIMVESTAVTPTGRTTPADLGLWEEQQVPAHQQLVTMITAHGAVPAVQLQCAGRKSSHHRPWEGAGQNQSVPVELGGWQTIAPSPIPFGDLACPRPATLEDIEDVVTGFASAAALADAAGYQAVEIHAGHGYLLHQFLSPLANHRQDEYGGNLENRMRLTLRVTEAVRSAFPADKPVFVRITATDWADGGITIEESTRLAKELAALGVDLLDVTSGVLLPTTAPPARPAVNAESARYLRDAAGLPVAPVGGFDDHNLIDRVVAAGQADAVFVGRGLLRDPYFPLRADDTQKTAWPVQYHRALS